MMWVIFFGVLLFIMSIRWFLHFVDKKPFNYSDDKIGSGTLWVFLFGAFLYCLSGVTDGDEVKEPPKVNRLTVMEQHMIDTQPLSKSTFNPLLIKIKQTRTAQPEHPFCDNLKFAYAMAMSTESKPSSSLTSVRLLKRLNEYYGVYSQAKLTCMNGEQVVTAPTTLKHPTTLSSESLVELTEVAKTCNTAKVLLTVKDDLESLTDGGVSKIVKDCRLDKLREELNK